MMWNTNYTYGNGMMWGNPFAGFVTAFLVPVLVWSLFWKGWALWKAVKNDSKPWFVVLLIVNTMGILDLLYVFVFSKMDNTQARTVKQTKKSSRK